ncbi:MAG: efflux RND transporter periplasmic adaptor subunit [Planctomycetota bacterium]|nr:efflux RND transporter periplasmic adaptor subunit [Planctomycetota bacterium]
MSVLRFILFLLVPAFLWGCGNHSHSHTPAEKPESAEWPTRAQTIWTQHHEFFFENEGGVVGRPTSFALHVTRLADGSPITEGALQLRFQNADQILNVEVPSPSRSGIYLAHVEFPSEGSWSWTASYQGDSSPLEAISIFFNESDLRASLGEAEGGGKGITMLKEQQWPVRLRVETARTQEYSQRIPATARVTTCRTHTAKVPAPVSGILLPPPSLPRTVLGQQVKAGDILATLKIPLVGASAIEYKASVASAKQEVKRAQAERTQMTAAFARVESLYAQEAKSAKDLEEAEYALRRAEVAHDAAGEIFSAWTQATPGSSMEILLLAPITGQVIQAPTASGEWALSGEPLFYLQNLSQLHVSIRVSEADLPQLGQSLQAEISHPIPGEPALFLPGPEGELLLSAPKVHPVTHSAEVLFEIPNPGWLRAGMTLPAQISTDFPRQGLIIPSSAIVQDAGISVIFVQTGGESFERRPVRMGVPDGDRTEILEGLSAGEHVVIDGAYVVYLVSLSGTIPEHSH